MFAATAMYHDWSGAEKDSVTVVQYSPSITGYHPTLIYLSGPGHHLNYGHQYINPPSSLYIRDVDKDKEKLNYPASFVFH